MSSDAGPLWRIVYVSREARPLSAAELNLLLERSRRHNAEHGITGLLVSMAGCFLQVLEGSRRSVDELYQRIRADERHREVTTLIDAPLAARQYGDWAMAQFGGEAREIPNLGAMRRLVSAFDHYTASGPDVASALLLEFRQQLTQSS